MSATPVTRASSRPILRSGESHLLATGSSGASRATARRSETISDRSYGVIVIDGDHGEEAALSDLLLADRAGRARGALVLLDDYGDPAWPGVEKALEQYLGATPPGLRSPVRRDQCLSAGGLAALADHQHGTRAFRQGPVRPLIARCFLHSRDG